MRSGAEHLPLLPATWVHTWGRTLVVAPHPDDESLGCGGALALLADAGQAVRVLFVSDGTGSHPHSRTHPPDVLRRLREREACAALVALGLSAGHARFMRLPDTRVPTPSTPGFAKAAARCAALLEDFRPETVLLPWRRDPHGDHRATWHLLKAATVGRPPRFLEYPIWVWDLGAAADQPGPDVRGRRLEVGAVLPRKRAAIAAHRSQLTDLISDDPTAFRLTADNLAHFDHPWEIYFEDNSEGIFKDQPDE